MGIDKLEEICADQVNRKEDKKLRRNRNAWTCLSQSIWEMISSMVFGAHKRLGMNVDGRRRDAMDK